MKTIKQGSKGAAVKELQSKLGIKADGDFGPITDRAVRAFQASKGLVVDGIVGPKTWAAFGVSKPTKPTTAPIPLSAPLSGKPSISASFQAHKDRTPPSVNPGTDYAVRIGTPIYAAHNGTVAIADKVDNSSGGKWVRIVGGNGVVTEYLHMSNINLNAGARVAKGSLIGHSGNTGNTTGPHLHFVLRINGKNVDPENYI